MSSARQWFTQHLQPSARVLDLGCGSGRDLRAFKEEGYQASGLEPVIELAVHARKFSGCEVLQATVQEAQFVRQFGGIWACASLLHVPRQELGQVLCRISGWVVDSGLIFASFKHGEGERFQEQRYFHDLTPALADTFFTPTYGWDLIESGVEHDANRPLIWTHILARQTPMG